MLFPIYHGFDVRGVLISYFGKSVVHSCLNSSNVPVGEESDQGTRH